MSISRPAMFKLKTSIQDLPFKKGPHAPAAKGRRVLLAVHVNTFFVELFRIAKILKADESWEPVMYFGWPYPTRDRDVKACRDVGLVCVDDDGLPNAELGEGTAAIALGTTRPGAVALDFQAFVRLSRRVLRGIVRRIHTAKSQLFLSPPPVAQASAPTCSGYLQWHLEQQAAASRLLAGARAELLILGGDMPGYDTSDYIAVARRLGIPVVLIPSTMSNGLEQAEAYFHNPEYQVIGQENELAAQRFPRWVREHRGRKLLRRPGGDILAMEQLGTAPPRPWGFNSGFADVVCAESQEMIDYYLDCGLPREQIVDTGSPANDVLAEYAATAPQRRSELLRELGLVDDRPLIVAALPPDFLYLDGGRPECDFRKYDDLVAFWHRSLTSLDHCNVLLSLHPSVSPEAFRHLETDNLRIGPGNTASLVPLADVYVASVSSTIRWAIASGKPVINYDVYRYRYTDYLHVPGVATMEEQVEFVAELDRMANDVEYRRKRTLQQQSVAERWGRLDGLAGRRLLEVFRKLTTPSVADAASLQGEAALKRSA